MNEIVEIKPVASVAAQSPSNAALILDPGHLSNMMAVAEIMATGITTVPKHLQKSPGDCLAVVMQATQWGMNPFAVAQKTHVVNGALGYEAQLVNAVLGSTGAISSEFSYEFKGGGDAVECRVGAVITGNKEITWGEWLSSAKVTTKNSPLWKTNPKQQMGYLQVKNWARAYCPGALLGVYTPDELEDRTPRKMGEVERLDAPSDTLLKAAYEAAAKGIAAYQAFWTAAGADGRKALHDLHTGLKQTAIDADKTLPPASPIIDPADNPEAGAAPAPTSAPTVTYAVVLDKMIKAKDIDAMGVAADWIGEIADPALRAELSAKYEALKAKLEA